jgi:Flp pilus assembly CpaF family ATPase
MFSAFDVVIQMRSTQDDKRGVAEIAEFVKAPDGTVFTQPLKRLKMAA